MNRLKFSLFCYGTLEFPEIMYRVTGDIFPAEAAYLPDFARYRLKNQVFPGLIHEPGACTEGTLYHDIRPRHLKLLDTYEGLLYCRQQLTVETEFDESCPALVYLVPAQKRSILSSVIWDKHAFARKDFHRFLKREFPVMNVE